MAKTTSFSEKYPHIAWWVECHGELETGQNYNYNSFVRLLDEGGLWWEDKNSKSLDEALDKAEAFLIIDLPDRFGDDFSLDDQGSGFTKAKKDKIIFDFEKKQYICEILKPFKISKT